MELSKERLQELEDIRVALKAPEAKRLLKRILTQSNLLAPSYAKGDALAMAYNEGLRGVGLWLRAEMEYAEPGSFSKIISK